MRRDRLRFASLGIAVVSAFFISAAAVSSTLCHWPEGDPRSHHAGEQPAFAISINSLDEQGRLHQPPDSFDHVTVQGSPTRALLLEAFRVLKPGGTVHLANGVEPRELEDVGFNVSAGSVAKPPSDHQSVFHNPQRYRDMLLTWARVPPPPSVLNDVDVYVFPTKYCPVGCSHCYFSSPVRRKGTAETAANTLSDDAIHDFLELTRTIGVKNLTITGGGDPFVEIGKTAQLVRSHPGETTEIHTSAYWAKSPDRAKEAVEELFRAHQQSPTSKQLTLRLSIDQFHAKVDPQAYRNLIDIFQANQARYQAVGLGLAIHSVDGDPAVVQFAESLKTDPRVARVESRIVDGKSTPSRIVFRSGMEIQVNYSPLFFPDQSPDLNDKAATDRSVLAFDGGRNPHPAVRLGGPSGPRGCLCLYEKGQIELWNSAPTDNLPNIYEHSPQQILSAFDDVIYSAAIEKGAKYVEGLIGEVDPLSVTRAKAVSSATLFNTRALAEPKTRLYVSLRVLQDMLAEGKIDDKTLAPLPQELRSLVTGTPAQLAAAYRAADWSVADELLRKKDVTIDELVALYRSVAKGQYQEKPDTFVDKVRRAPGLSVRTKEDFAREAGSARGSLPMVRR